VRRPWLALLVLPLPLAGCGDDAPADERAFCTRLERLADNDPFTVFGERATATEIESAFQALVARAEELVDGAPDDVRGAARDYADAAESLDDLMAAAAYQGDQVDARAYREEQVRYTEAATRLERYLDSCRGSVTTAGDG
jgi:hypothetical protein